MIIVGILVGVLAAELAPVVSTLRGYFQAVEHMPITSTILIIRSCTSKWEGETKRTNETIGVNNTYAHILSTWCRNQEALSDINTWFRNNHFDIYSFNILCIMGVT